MERRSGVAPARPPLRRRRWLVGAAIILALAVTSAVLLVSDRGVYVEVVNQTREPLEDVRLASGLEGDLAGLPRIEPGQARGVHVPRGAVVSLALSYALPGGARSDDIRLGFGPAEEYRLEPKIRLGIIPDPRKPGENSFYIKRRRIYDPSRLFGP